MQRTIWIASLTAVLGLAGGSAKADDFFRLGTSADAATMTLALTGDVDTVPICGWRCGGCGWGRGYAWGGYGGYGSGGYGYGYGWGGYYASPYYAGYSWGYPSYYYPSTWAYSSPYVGSTYYYSTPSYYYGYSASPSAYSYSPTGYYYQPTPVVVAPLAQTQPQQSGAAVYAPAQPQTYAQQTFYQATSSPNAPAVPVIAPLQAAPAPGFDYNGGPASTVPMPGGERAIPQKKNPDLKDVRFAPRPKFTYSAYGEQAKPTIERPAASTLTSQTTDI